ncbi:tetratricopeptide repeat protein [Nonlabens xiamenensis]|uniref:tetratricopeptide repeat protein n=1 Tax=Nonlabens xiamenensis TaxID=2341043 RepID=UPI000F610CE1|nr:tetratricopeptide repeat protein [Nonlabens xiamenensis]
MRKILIVASFFTSIFMTSQEVMGDSLVNVGEYQKALLAYQSIGSQQRPYFKIARVNTQMGNIDEAIDAYIQGFRIDSTSVAPQFEFAKLSLRINDPVTAFNMFTDLIDKHPKNPSYRYYLGQVCERINNENAALKAYQEAIELVPTYRVARKELVILYIKKRRFTEAIELAQFQLDVHPKDIKFNSLIAQAYFESKRYEKAIEHFELLFTLGNDTEFNRKQLGQSYFQNQNWEKAVEQFLIYLEDYEEKDAGVHFLISQAYLRLGKIKLAQDYIERSIALKTPVLDQEFLQLATVYSHQEDFKNAYYAVKKAASEAPGSDVIGYQLAVAADRHFSDPETKLKHYEKFLEAFPESRYKELAAARVSDLRKQVFLKGDQ